MSVSACGPGRKPMFASDNGLPDVGIYQYGFDFLAGVLVDEKLKDSMK
jgi:hypothetical protein